MLDYLEQTSLKFHIEQLLLDNIEEPYIYQNYMLEISKSKMCITFQITDTSATKGINKIIQVIHKSKYDFEHFLVIFENTLKKFMIRNH
jgi:hypothetical protein